MANILIGISGSVAAYKMPLLVRLLRKRGDNVRVVMTEAAKRFVTPITLQALTGDAVRTELFDEAAELGMSHIELARWADVYVVAPATANTLAKLAGGFADNLLTTLALATNAPLLIAPAMNQQMWKHEAVEEQVEKLAGRSNVHLALPDVGEQACGDVGSGRMVEPEMLLGYIDKALCHQSLVGKKILLTAGATQERIDPVRYLSNDSSGKMGYALASEAWKRGAEVVLVSGKTALPTPVGVEKIEVQSALEMYEQVMNRVSKVDWFVGCAAVADYRPEVRLEQKHKKNEHGVLTLKLIENPDILASVARLEERPICVGFAAESEHLLQYAREKRKRKGVDYMVANDIRDGVFGSDENRVIILSEQGEHALPRQSKSALAGQIWDYLLQQERLCRC
ncbi:MAG: bifunctional phosphopantothenoylcysteine decarboxylase/phosphopantothenate--cysteine ligase CoaBC [Cardiobacteriaceae bacterium]|nr:bifunctional phosphopantothenoylcysteine decarboxylase/phosphopantothenate--cysteine ligase CoaBC [Cardiobacteriaceae bacterium]